MSAARLVPACLVAVVAAAALSTCGAPAEQSATEYAPATLAPIEGTDAKRVTFTREGAARVDVRTARIDGAAVPYAAVVYDAQGDAFVYASRGRLSFVRVPIEIDRVEGHLAVVTTGPPAGTEVVTVGTAEVFGTEFEVDH
jgi:hypothetical protein